MLQKTVQLVLQIVLFVVKLLNVMHAKLDLDMIPLLNLVKLAHLLTVMLVLMMQLLAVVAVLVIHGSHHLVLNVVLIVIQMVVQLLINAMMDNVSLVIF
jgi:hypothetical protein